MRATLEYSPFSAEVKTNPYPFYAWLREEQPVYYNERHDFWAVSRYKDVVTVARHPEWFTSSQGVGPDKSYGLSMITNDPPTHTRLRKLVHNAFTPSMIARYTSRIQDIVDELLDTIIDKGSFDLIADFAIPLPVTVIAEMLGVEPERMAEFKRWSDDVIHFTAGAEDRDREVLRGSWNEFRAYFLDIMAKRRQEPQDDAISILVQAHEDDALSEMEILNFCQLLLVAGNETTTNLIANGAAALARFPEQWQQLRENPDRVQSAVEEVLRFDSPIQLVYRTTTCDVEVGGTIIPADSKVALLWASANHDRAEFEAPEQFDIIRTPNRHVAFGSGIHYCLGSSLARLEARTALATMARRIPRVRMVSEADNTRVDNPLLRGLTRCPMICEPVSTNAG